ncbi:SLIT-ROBO Rho GTPase-activating protein 3 [Physeter macrocephalus]|uniref:SLIT-ROBO Rho GTPase-activating protein 3 n=1 Tax=Physeter macrocephalus TaxID=9755 RepID=A0A455AEJ9_PHYMC|nr:SLIT-ROBO Rho GTPase-activating protein 3-like [Physeter catodon]|eukprot:XP_028334632.1 SLIT-ROBO Rho GTPase-activating protein 3-like [Physeter catodon]
MAVIWTQPRCCRETLSPTHSALNSPQGTWLRNPEIRTQLVEQFKCLEQQSESRLQLLQDLQEFFRRKAEIELEYSRSLEKLAERFSSKIRSSREHQFKKDQYLLSPVNCWYLVLHQTRRESRDHATLNDIFMNNVIVRLSQISEDVIRLFKKSKEIGLQMHEELLKVTNELYTKSENTVVPTAPPAPHQVIRCLH